MLDSEKVPSGNGLRVGIEGQHHVIRCARFQDCECMPTAPEGSVEIPATGPRPQCLDNFPQQHRPVHDVRRLLSLFREVGAHR
jgi:hypothetical protein